MVQTPFQGAVGGRSKMADELRLNSPDRFRKQPERLVLTVRGAGLSKKLSKAHTPIT